MIVSRTRCGILHAAASGERTSCRRRYFIREPIDSFRLGKPGDGKLAEIAPASGAAILCEAGGSDHGAVQVAGDLFQPGGKVDRGADAGEIEAVGAANISVEHGANM